MGSKLLHRIYRSADPHHHSESKGTPGGFSPRISTRSPPQRPPVVDSYTDCEPQSRSRSHGRSPTPPPGPASAVATLVSAAAALARAGGKPRPAASRASRTSDQTSAPGDGQPASETPSNSDSAPVTDDEDADP